jgi:topoisomerase-4 subunit A
MPDTGSSPAFADLVTRNTKGQGHALATQRRFAAAPIPAGKHRSYLLAAVTSEGRMLVFPLDKLPALAKGKGNKIIQIPPKRARERMNCWFTYASFPKKAP